MGSKRNYPIRFYRSGGISENRDAAILKLNTAVNKVGQPVIVKYFSDPDQTKIDIIFAIGILDGSGPGTYRIISTAGIVFVADVSYELPDIAQLVHGELYIYNDGTKSYIVYESDGERKYTEIQETQTVVSIETGKSWYVSSDQIKEVSDFNTKSEIQAIVKELDQKRNNEINALDEKISELNDYIGKGQEDLIGQITQDKEELSERIIELENSVFSYELHITSGLIVSIPVANLQSPYTVKLSCQRKGVTVDPASIILTASDGSEITVGSDWSVSVVPGSERSLYFTVSNPSQTVTGQSETMRFRAIRTFWWLPVSENFKLSDLRTVEAMSGIQTGTYGIGWSNPVFEASLDNQKVLFIIPWNKNHEVYSVLDQNNFEYIQDYEVSGPTEYNGEYYMVYLKKMPVTINNFKQTWQLK